MTSFIATSQHNYILRSLLPLKTNINMDFDSYLSEIGEFGRYQRKVFLLLSTMTLFHCGQFLLLVFVADKPTWVCAAWETDLIADRTPGHPCYANGSTCNHVQFDDEFTSIATEWGLICDQEFKANFAQSVMMAGCLIGVLVSGRLADGQGRKWVVVYSQVFGYSFGLLTAFAQTYTQFLAARFLTGLTLMGAGLSLFVLLSEIIGPSYRGPVLAMSQVPFSFGFGLLAYLAYVFREWRYLCMATSIPGLLFTLFSINKFHESPRWLLANGRFSEAEQIVTIIAKSNNRYCSKRENFKNINQTKSNNSAYSLATLFTYGSIRRKVVPLTFMWLVCSMVYYGLSFNVTNIEGNKYWNFILSGLVEIPSSLIVTPLINNIGRRWSLFIFTMVGASSCLLVGMGPTSWQTMTALVGKFGISAAFSLLYIYSGELIPTVIRNSAMGYCSMTARVGGILAPMVVALATVDQKLPMVIFGLSALLSSTIGLVLPETLNNAVGETLDEDSYKTIVNM